MPSYLVQASYTSEAMAALVKNPQNRSEVVRKSIENLGGKLVGAWMAFGDHDVVFIVDMPDTISAAAMALSLGAGGALKGTKTTLLITLETDVPYSVLSCTTATLSVLMPAAFMSLRKSR